jgi:hypothetical protein
LAAEKSKLAYEEMFNQWMAERRDSARQILKAERLKEKEEGHRKEIGQITAQEIEDYILLHYPKEHKEKTDKINEWGNNEKIFLELRDTLKDRANHLQTLINNTKEKITKPTY